MASHHRHDWEPFNLPTRRSIRLKDHDYAAGIYFLTICVARKKPLLSMLEQHHVRLSRVGEIVEEEWLRTGEMRSGVWLDAYVIMPDHFHGIIGLDPVAVCRGFESRAHTVRPYWLRETLLGRVVAGFKSVCTRRYRDVLGNPAAALWQRGYYERVVRGNQELQRIRRYITENPLRVSEATSCRISASSPRTGAAPRSERRP
jgi:putative transposase